MVPDEPPDPRELLRRLERKFAQDEAELRARIANINAEFVFALLVQWAYVVHNSDGRESESEQLSTLLEYVAFHLYARFGAGGLRDPELEEDVMERLKSLHQRRPMLTVGLGDGAQGRMEDAARHASHHCPAPIGFRGQRQLESVLSLMKDCRRA
jgi:hypothetical protein